MSLVTTVVFYCEFSETRDRFKHLCETLYTRYKDGIEVNPCESGGTKVAHGYAFHIGFNYIDYELIEALSEEPWPPGTILLIHEEGLEDPKIWVGGMSVTDVPAKIIPGSIVVHNPKPKELT